MSPNIVVSIVWKALSNRIVSLIDAATFLASTLKINSSDSGAGKKRIAHEATVIFDEIARFRDSFANLLPQAAVLILAEFCTKNEVCFKVDSNALQDFQVRLILLSIFRSGFEFAMRDNSIAARRLSERAFAHLQRSIIADVTVQRRWRCAFRQHETACEKLGAVHLLQHGIWAFKASATGERTDLVLGDPISNLMEVEAVAEALVLTEWKLVRISDNPIEKAKEGREQAQLYGAGSLAGIELANYRYVILVSERRIESLPSSEMHAGIEYRYRNIALFPLPPSQQVRM